MLYKNLIFYVTQRFRFSTEASWPRCMGIGDFESRRIAPCVKVPFPLLFWGSRGFFVDLWGVSGCTGSAAMGCADDRLGLVGEGRATAKAGEDLAGASSAKTLSNVLVVAGPSGVGKGTLIGRLLATWPDVRVNVPRTSGFGRSQPYASHRHTVFTQCLHRCSAILLATRPDRLVATRFMEKTTSSSVVTT